MTLQNEEHENSSINPLTQMEPLTNEEAHAAEPEWMIRGSDNQVQLTQPETWLLIGGRGAGKTRTGAEWVNGLALGYAPMADKPTGPIALVGETLADVREVMVEGPAGILASARAGRPRFEPSRRRLVWDTSGMVAYMFSSEDPESLRGPQFAAAWCDELGCPAIDKAANQPNVFPDAKSSAAATPYFSNGGRDDEAQLNFLAAHFTHWAEAANNPVSSQYAGRMLDMENTYLWAWDARPFPAFPLIGDAWGDGANWQTGHWLSGRLGNIALRHLVSTIFAEHGLSNIDVSKFDGVLAGYTIDRPSSIREALDALLALYRVDVSERAGTLQLVSRDRALPKSGPVSGLALGRDDLAVNQILEAESQAPGELSLEFRDIMRDHQQASVTSRIDIETGSIESIALPATLDLADAKVQLRQFHRQESAARNTVTFSSSWADAALQAGDLVQLEDGGESYRITKITDTEVRQFEGELALPGRPYARRSNLTAQTSLVAAIAGPPLSVFLDLPALPSGSTNAGGLRLAAWMTPWTPVVALSSPSNENYAEKVTLPDPALIGTLATALPAGVSGRIFTKHWFEIDLLAGGLASCSELSLFNGANAAAIKSANGAWEILQFGKATEVSAGRLRLERLLRGQLGTIDAMEAGAAIGGRFVLLDASVKRCELTNAEADIALNWKVGPASKAVSDQYFASQNIDPAVRSTKANAPVHVSAKTLGNGDTVFTWQRCGSLNADSWEVAEIPLVESAEEYRVRVKDINLVVKRETNVANGQWIYTGANRQADFGAGTASCIFEVSQISATGLPGLARTTNLTI
jgi:hypothetical protein